MSWPTNIQAADIGFMVAEHAARLFELCGAKDDFCVQSLGTVAVFGGLNRVVFNPATGWRAERSHCSPRFMAQWEGLSDEVRRHPWLLA